MYLPERRIQTLGGGRFAGVRVQLDVHSHSSSGQLTQEESDFTNKQKCLRKASHNGTNNPTQQTGGRSKMICLHSRPVWYTQSSEPALVKCEMREFSRRQRTTSWSLFSFHHVIVMDGTHIVRLGEKHLPPRYLACMTDSGSNPGGQPSIDLTLHCSPQVLLNCAACMQCQNADSFSTLLFGFCASLLKRNCYPSVYSPSTAKNINTFS